MSENSIPMEKEFIIRHSISGSAWFGFNDDPGPKQIRYGIPWYIQSYSKTYCADIYLFCGLEDGPTDWSIDTDYEMKMIGKRKCFEKKGSVSFEGKDSFIWTQFHWDTIKKYMVNGKLKVEFRVKINKMNGFEDSGDVEMLKDDDDEEVVLVVEGEKFNVDKKFLADHSTYFNTLFFESVEESGKSEIEIEDVNASDFKNFLTLLREELVIDDNKIDGILELAVKYDSKTAIEKCVKFLSEKSKKSLKEKFNTAIKYKLNKLKKTCLSEMTSRDEIAEIATEKATHFNASVWKELLQKALVAD